MALRETTITDRRSRVDFFIRLRLHRKIAKEGKRNEAPKVTGTRTSEIALVGEDTLAKSLFGEILNAAHRESRRKGVKFARVGMAVEDLAR